MSSGMPDWQWVGLILARKAVREVHLLHLLEKKVLKTSKDVGTIPHDTVSGTSGMSFYASQTPASLIPQSLVMACTCHMALNKKN